MITIYRSIRTATVCCAGPLFYIIVYYGIYREPYCFYKRPLYSEGLSSLAESKIHTYQRLPSPSTNKNLVVILIPEISPKIIQTLQFLDKNLADNYASDIVIMYNGEPNKNAMLNLSKSVHRQVLYLDVSSAFNLFPTGFDPCLIRTTFYKRGKWNYQLMIISCDSTMTHK
jgi:hypothetical protein